MTELHTALEELLAAHDKIGSALSRSAIPGRPAQETRDRLAQLGFTDPGDLADWFSWHEFDEVAWKNAGGLGAPTLFWWGWPMNLDQAIEKYRHYEASVDRFMDPTSQQPEQEQWRSSWFPIIWSSPADIVVDDGGRGTDSARVRRVENQPTVPPGPAAPIIFRSLVDLARAATRSVRDHSRWEAGAIELRDDSDGLIEHY